LSVSVCVAVRSTALIAQATVTVISPERPGLVQTPPPVTKFDPVRAKTVPTLTLLLGVKMTLGTTVNDAAALSPKLPVSVMVTGPAGLLGILTTNEPTAAPPEIEHEGVPSIVLPTDEVIPQLPSPVLNPEPVTRIVSPPLPLSDEGVIDGAVTVKVSETDGPGLTTGSVKYTVCGPVLAVPATLKLPVKTPFAPMVQAGADKKAGTPGMELSAAAQNPAARLVLNPDPDSVTAVPFPPSLGVTTSFDLTMNCAAVTSFGTDPGSCPVNSKV